MRINKKTEVGILNVMSIFVYFLILLVGLKIVIAVAPIFTNAYHGQVFNATQGQEFVYYLNGNDTDLQYPLNFTYVLVGNLSSFRMSNYNDTTALINFTPNNDDVGFFQINLNVQDSATPIGEINAIIIFFNVSNVNDPPNITLHFPLNYSINGTENSSSISFNFTATDPDLRYGDNLSSHWMIDGIIVLENSSNFDYDPLFCDAGIRKITINVTDLAGAYDYEEWNVTVSNLNRAPLFNYSTPISNNTWFEDSVLQNNFSLFTYFSDNDYLECNGSNKDILNFSATGNSHITIAINNTTGDVSFYPAGNWSGNETIRFRASDGKDMSYSNYVTLFVSNVNDAPTLLLTQNKTWANNHAYSEQIMATDPDTIYGDSLTYNYTLNETFASFAMSSNGLISFTPTDLDIGIHWINISVSDSQGEIAWGLRRFAIINNSAPVLLTINNQTATENLLFNITVYANDLDGDSLNFTPDYARLSKTVINSSAVYFYFTPLNPDVGSHTVNVVVSDIYGATDTKQFTIQVNDVNNPPVVDDITYKVAKINRTFVLYVNATDGDNDVLTFISNSTLVNITNSSYYSTYSQGLINFTPTINDTGDYTINITVRDILNLADSTVFNITITQNRAPVIVNISDKIAYTGIEFSMDVAAPDPDFDIVNVSTNYSRFSYLRINESYFTLKFTPLSSDIGNITIQVYANDSDGLTSNTTFNLNITRFNHAPYFENVTNYTCTINTTCNFDIEGYDIDGDSLEFNMTSFNYNVTIINNTLNSSTARFRFYVNSTYAPNTRVNISVFDGIAEGKTSTYIIVNYPPIIDNYYPINLTFEGAENSTIIFNHTSYDPEGSALNYSWRVSKENATLVLSCNLVTQNNASICNADSRCYWNSNLSVGNQCTPINAYETPVEYGANYNYIFTADYTSSGKYKIYLYVFDDYFANTSTVWNINISDVNRVPVFGKKRYAASDFSLGIFNYTAVLNDTFLSINFSNGSYFSYGEYTSPVIDFGTSLEITYGNITWNESITNGTSIIFQVRSSPNSSMDVNWSNNINYSNSQMEVDSNRYLQYKIIMQTNDTNTSPIINGVEINYKISNKNLQKNIVLLNWIDLDDFMYDLDTDNIINITGYGNSNINVEVDQSTRRVNLRPLTNYLGEEIIWFKFSDGKSSVYSNNITISVIDNSTNEDQQPMPQSGGGGGGGGGAAAQQQQQEQNNENNNKLQNFKMIRPGVPVYYQNGTIETPVRIVNSQNKTLSEISLSAQTDLNGTNVSLTKNFIEKLNAGEEEIITLRVKTKNIYGSFEVVIDGKVKNPEFEDSAKVIMTTLEKADTNKTQAETRLYFVRDLLTQNPECLELNEMLERASSEIKKGNTVTASDMLDSVIETCKYLITRKDSAKESPSPAVKWKEDIINLIKSPWVYLSMLSFALTSVLIISYYIYKKPKNPSQTHEGFPQNIQSSQGYNSGNTQNSTGSVNSNLDKNNNYNYSNQQNYNQRY